MINNKITNWIKTGYYFSSSTNTDKDQTFGMSTKNSKRSHSSVSSCFSFSKLPSNAVYEFLGFKNIDEFLNLQKVKVSDFFELVTASEDIKKKVYKSIRELLACYKFPNYLSDELDITVFVSGLIGSLVTELNFSLEINERFTMTRKCMMELNEDEISQLQSVLSCQFARIPKGSPDMVVLDSKDNILICVEVKRDTVESAIEQCILYLKIAYRLNRKKIVVYGIATNAVDWSVIAFDGTKFSSLFKMPVLFPQMQFLEYETHWIENYSTIVDILHTIFVSNYVKKPQSKETRSIIENSKAKKFKRVRK